MDSPHRPPLALRLRNGDRLLVNDQHLRLNGSPLPINRLAIRRLKRLPSTGPQPYALRGFDADGQCCWHAPIWLFEGDDFQRLLQRLEQSRWPLDQQWSRLHRWLPITLLVILLLLGVSLPLVWR